MLRQVFAPQFLLSKIGLSVGFLEGTEVGPYPKPTSGILEPSQKVRVGLELQGVERKKKSQVNRGSKMNGECGSKREGLISSSLKFYKGKKTRFKSRAGFA